jgi:signal transduction histidine kinase
MRRGGSNSSILRIMRGFAAPLRLCQRMWAAVTPGATTGVSAANGHATKLRAALLTACMGLALSAAGCLQASAATRQVVLLFDERVELPGLALLDKELANTLRANSPEPVEIYREAMDLSRFDSNSYKEGLRDFLRTKYANKRIDAAVAIMAPALDFLLTYGDLIFPGTPIVFCGLDRTQLGTRRLSSNVYGALVRREFGPTVELALRIHPDTKRFVVIGGTSEFDKKILAQARDQLLSYQNRVSFSYLSELPLEQLLARVSKLSPGDIVLFLTLFEDGAGQSFVPHEVVERISEATSVPIYGALDEQLGHGITGGSLYSLTAYGSDTANMILRLLTGAAPSQHLSENFDNKIIFDWRQMMRWGIDESRLPPGTAIYFREATAWERYSWQLVLVGAIILVQAGFISLLLHEHRRRRLAEVQARQRMAELAHINRFSTAGELTASISHEINQPLGTILTNAETARAILKSPHPDLDELNEIVDDILQDDRRATEVIRRMRSLLKKTPFEPKNIDFNDLVREAIDFLSALAVARKVELGRSIAPNAIPIVGDRIQLQQVILNLLINAIDAMSGTAGENRIVNLRTSRVENFAELSISDRGPGIPADKLKEVFEPFFTTKAEGMGMGLSIARTIVEAHDGQIFAANEPGAGAVFRVRLPIAHHTAASASTQPALG